MSLPSHVLGERWSRRSWYLRRGCVHSNPPGMAMQCLERGYPAPIPHSGLQPARSAYWRAITFSTRAPALE